MIIETLEIIEPTEQVRKAKPGETKEVEYELKNIGEFPLVDFDFEVYTIKKTGYDKKSKEPIFKKTSRNYATLVNTPESIHPGKSFKAKVEIKVPGLYTETVKTADGREQRTPFRVHFGVHALEDIKEL